MRLRVVALLACAVLVLGPAGAFAAATLPSDQIAAIDAAVRKAITEHHVPSVVIEISRNGERVFGRAWGKRNLGDDVPATVDTTYQYGSITKQITAMSIFLLAQDGKLSLDDAIGRYLPLFANKPVTIRQVLVHTSGLADFTDLPDYPLKIAPQLSLGAEWGLKWAASRPLDFPPGTKAKYSNTGYVVLARIIETVSGQPFTRFLQTRVFPVASMRVVHPFQYFVIRPNEASGYLWWGKEIAGYISVKSEQGAELNHVVKAPEWNLQQADGAGFLVGDASDLQNWNDALLAGRFLRGKWRTLYFTSGTLNNGSPAYVGPENATKERPSYCYGGFGKMVTSGGHTVYGANGGTFGFTTFTGIVPDRHLSLTILTNLGEFDNRDLTVPVIRALLR